MEVRGCGDPDRRHDRAAIGYASSADLRRWELQPDALVHADPGAWDDLAVWTGSVARAPDGTWRLFYTGRLVDGAFVGELSDPLPIERQGTTIRLAAP